MKPSRTLLALSTLALAAAEQAPCTLRHCGTSLDLNPLTAEKDYVFEAYTGRNFTLNVCKSVTTEPWNPRVDSPKDIGGFTRGAHGDISLGETNTTLLSRDGQPVIIMTNGSPCEKDSGRRASTVVRFICDESVETGSPHLVAQLPPEDDADGCAFFIEWRTRYACSSKDQTNITLYILALAVVVILLAAILFFVYARLFQRSTSSVLPLPPHISSSPTNIRARFQDFTRFVLRRDPWGDPNDMLRMPSENGNGYANGNGHIPGPRKSWFPWRRPSNRSRAGFSRLAQTPEEEAMMRGSFEDDDDDERQGNGHAGGRFGDGDESGLNSSAVWGETRPNPNPRGMDGSGVIRL